MLTQSHHSQMKMIKTDEIFHIRSMKIWHKFKDDSLSNLFRNMFTLNREIHKPVIDVSCIYFQHEQLLHKMCSSIWFQNYLVNFLMKSLKKLKLTLYLLLSATSNVILLIHIVQVAQQPNVTYVKTHNECYGLVQKRHGCIASGTKATLLHKAINKLFSYISYFFLIIVYISLKKIDNG